MKKTGTAQLLRGKSFPLASVRPPARISDGALLRTDGLPAARPRKACTGQKRRILDLFKAPLPNVGPDAAAPAMESGAGVPLAVPSGSSCVSGRPTPDGTKALSLALPHPARRSGCPDGKGFGIGLCSFIQPQNTPTQG